MTHTAFRILVFRILHASRVLILTLIMFISGSTNTCYLIGKPAAIDCHLVFSENRNGAPAHCRRRVRHIFDLFSLQVGDMLRGNAISLKISTVKCS